jgi:hypothetical protein
LANASDDPTSYNGPFGGLFCFMDNNGGEACRQLEADLTLVGSATERDKRSRLTAFLSAPWNEFRAGVFEVYLKACLLRRLGQANVALDWAAAAGARECDAKVLLDELPVIIEATVLSTSDEEKETTRRALDAGARVYTSPGPFDPPGSRAGVRCYYTTVRIYAKVYEKLAPDLRLGACQFPAGGRSVLALSLDGAHEHICYDDTDPAFETGVYWAFDELFLDQPWGTCSPPGTSIDISLGGWLDHHARELDASGRLNLDEYCENRGRLIELPRRIAGVLLFGQTALRDARVNYHADLRFSHSQMAKVEELFGEKRKY